MMIITPCLVMHATPLLLSALRSIENARLFLYWRGKVWGRENTNVYAAPASVRRGAARCRCRQNAKCRRQQLTPAACDGRRGESGMHRICEPSAETTHRQVASIIMQSAAGQLATQKPLANKWLLVVFGR
ncbi:hypothetical protein EDB80DRAFT_77476 [Ilyonectria destructans]|nr:hypothetical protein EDB80DRAFT_77476 [Ilyonectria destructans]